MKRVHLPLFVTLMVCLQSCEFRCSVGNKDEEVKGAAKVKDGARVYNNIDIVAKDVELNKAYLVLEDGSRVPDDNFVDFKKPINLQLTINNGWKEENGKVFLGASEVITDEKGNIVLQEDDLFNTYPNGIDAADAKYLYLTATLKLREGAAPTSFKVAFRVWDKKGSGSIEGSYQLFSK